MDIEEWKLHLQVAYKNQKSERNENQSEMLIFLCIQNSLSIKYCVCVCVIDTVFEMGENINLLYMWCSSL